ncbi:protein involved in DNA integration [Arthrobacter sp. Hiyo1]|nr:protein involved in DNA integration [Arthrobacter sp. Hiyo1]
MTSARSQTTALRWVHEATHRTRVLNSTLDLSDSRLRVLSRELGQSWYEVATTLGYAPTTVRRMSVVVRKFIEFAQCGDVEDGVSLADSGASLVECIHQWELSLRQGYAATSNMPYKDGMQLLQIIRWHIRSGRPAGSLVRSRAGAKPLAPSRKETPVDELPNGIRIQLRDSCRAIIRDAESRIQRGTVMVSNGAEVNDAPGPLPGILRLLPTEAPGHSLAGDRVRSVAARTRNHLNGLNREAGAESARIRARSRFVLPASLSSRELQAFRILLLMETGWAPEQLTDMRLGAMKWGDGKVSITTQKLWARTMKSHEYHQGNSRWNVYALLERLLALTEPIRHLTTARREEQYLLVRLNRSGPETYLTNEIFKQYLLKDLVKDVGISWTGPFDIRRIRKTFKSVQGAVTGTAAGAAGMDHTVQVSRGHYMQTTTIHVLAAKVTNAAQEYVYNSILQGPAVIPARAKELRLAGDDETVRDLAGRTVRESPKDMEMGVTACRNPYASPFTTEGKLCHVRPSMCFLCPNALIFQDHLPRILSFRETLLAQRPNYHPQEFQSAWGGTLDSIEAILREFSPAQLKTAADAGTASIHVPISQRVHF